MPVFRAPVDDYRFLLTDLFDAAALSKYPGYEEGTPDLLLAAIEEAGKFCEEVLFPLNMTADAIGCQIKRHCPRQRFDAAFAGVVSGKSAVGTGGTAAGKVDNHARLFARHNLGGSQTA